MVDLELARSFFMWCTIINAGIFVFSFLMVTLAGDWVYRMHGIWFALSRDTFTAIIYSFFGLFKILIIVFNLVPYVALLLLA